MNVPEEYFIFKISILKKLILITIGLSTAAFFAGQRGFSAGILVGGLISAAVFSMLYKYVLRVRGISPSNKRAFLISRYLLIYGVMALTLLIGIKKGIGVFLGAASGLILLKVVIFWEGSRQKYVG
jgi:hypothetical protein